MDDDRENIRKRVKELAELLSKTQPGTVDAQINGALVQGLAAYLAFESSERNLAASVKTVTHMRISAWATVVLAAATVALAIVTAFR